MNTTCLHWIGRENRHRTAAEDVGFFLTGWRCPAHSPSALVGEPEPGAGRYCPPKRCWCGSCPWWTTSNPYLATADSWPTDARAIASGKRRASPQEQAAAKATVAEQKKREQQLRKGVA